MATPSTLPLTFHRLPCNLKKKASRDLTKSWWSAITETLSSFYRLNRLKVSSYLKIPSPILSHPSIVLLPKTAITENFVSYYFFSSFYSIWTLKVYFYINNSSLPLSHRSILLPLNISQNSDKKYRLFIEHRFNFILGIILLIPMSLIQ